MPDQSKPSAERLRFMSRGGHLLSSGVVTVILSAYIVAITIGLCIDSKQIAPVGEQVAAGENRTNNPL